MTIKEEIGHRIEAERKAKGLTRKALAELTDDLKQSRINNWERGIRTPGPEEIKQLARALDVSPSFLMCLTDHKQHPHTASVGALIPVLDHQQACDAHRWVQAINNGECVEGVSFIPVSNELAAGVGEHAFALKMKDDSMRPELKIHDVLIIDPDCIPSPGNFVVAKLEDDSEVIVRRYRQLSAIKKSHEFELLALNDAWASIRIDNAVQSKIIGVVINLTRMLNS